MLLAENKNAQNEYEPIEPGDYWCEVVKSEVRQNRRSGVHELSVGLKVLAQEGATSTGDTVLLNKHVGRWLFPSFPFNEDGAKRLRVFLNVTGHPGAMDTSTFPFDTAFREVVLKCKVNRRESDGGRVFNNIVRYAALTDGDDGTIDEYALLDRFEQSIGTTRK